MNTFNMRINKRFLATIVFIILLLINCTASKNKIPIVISPDADRVEILAAEELADHVTMGAVQLHPIEAGTLRANRRPNEIRGQLFDFRGGQAPRTGLLVV